MKTLPIALLSLGFAQATTLTPEFLLQRETDRLMQSAAIEPDTPFAQALRKSTDWQRELLDSGPFENPSVTMVTLHALWKHQPEIATHPIDRSMASACALESARSGMNPEQAIVRFRFFHDRHRNGELNAIYDELDTFNRRFLARGVQHTAFNSPESMDYLVSAISLPSQQYTSACWYAAYRSNNAFGDSIHGPHYYSPFRDSWGSHAERVREVGGVCGSLSNLGAAAAIANGIPAVTMGEPGHCAYAVMTSPGNWVPAYTLSWKRGMHTSFDASSWGWHRLITEAMKSREKISKSNDLRRLAMHQLESGKTAPARQTIRLARTSHPIDWSNWTASAKILNESSVGDDAWQQLHQDLLSHLAPISGECAHHFLRSTLYPRILPKGDAHLDARRKILLSFHRSINDWGLARWDFASALDHELKLLGGTPEAGDDFLAETFAVHRSSPALSSEVLAVQMRRAGKNGARLKNFITRIGRTLSANPDDSNTGAVIDTLAAAVLPSAAASGDRETFQFIGRLTARNYPALAISPDAFPGILLSSGGCFRIQKPGNRWDTPSRHWGVIEEHGGDFHTDAKPATATVQLGNFGRLTGVVIVTRSGSISRLNNAVLESSIDGENWTPLHHFKNVSQIQRIDLREAAIDAGFVRVRQENHPSLHFHKLLVYGHKKN